MYYEIGLNNTEMAGLMELFVEGLDDGISCEEIIRYALRSMLEPLKGPLTGLIQDLLDEAGYRRIYRQGIATLMEQAA
jgi:hypothetical protein